MIARSATLLCLVLAACEHESAGVPERPDPVVVAEIPADASVAPVIADAAVEAIVDAAPGAPKVSFFESRNRKVLDEIIDRNLDVGAFKDFPQTGSSTTASDIDRAIKRHAAVFKACYQRELAKGRDLGGKVILRFTISETGAVSKATASGMDRAVEDCLVAAVKRIVFAPPPDGKPAHVTYPLLFNNP